GALRTDAEGTVEVFQRLIFEFLPPRWNIVWNGIAVNRSSSRLGNGNRSSMNKIKIGMVEIIAIKIINSRTECSGSHESIELFVFEKASRTSINLITVILADDSLIVI